MRCGCKLGVARRPTNSVQAASNEIYEFAIGYFMYGQIAQLVEQRIENPRADGSSPSLTTQ